MNRVARSWVFGANDPMLGFGVNHLPFTAFVHPERGERRLGVGIGACVFDLHAAVDAMPQDFDASLAQGTLNGFMGLGGRAWAALRARLQGCFDAANQDRAMLERCLLDARGLVLELPATVGDYTDFYASRHHARRVGELFRPEKPLLENYDWLPIGYHGRSSSLVASGTGVRRPWGQRRGEVGAVFAPSAKLDYELELGCYVGIGNELGEPVGLEDAEAHLFGVSLLNDWSARDVQAWEYQPLGPFLGKNFCTSVSPWITPMAALEPFRIALQGHDETVLANLDSDRNRETGAIALELQTEIAWRGGSTVNVARTNSRELYWTPAQMLAHHTSGGCNLRPGDLLGTGTISGPEREEAGCLLELTRNGTEPIPLAEGVTRGFLADGDEVILTGWAQAGEDLPVRLGTCRGTVLAART